MTDHSHDALTEVQRRADACAKRLLGSPPAVDGISGSESDWSALLDAIRAVDPRFAFDAAGRPPALDAVRHALPSVERELFDVILEDYQCEIAAVREAAYQLVRAIERDRRTNRE